MLLSPAVIGLAALPFLAGALAATLPDPLLAAYWGQSGSEQSLKAYCELGYFNLIAIGFVDHFGATAFNFDTDGCSSSAASPSTCSSLASQITYCQKQGIAITLSLGGATVQDCGDTGCTGEYYFASATQATQFAQNVWQMFFNGGKSTSGVVRPFGSVVLDGIDLDVEMTAKGDGQTPQLYYDSFVSALRAYDSSIIIGAAPECQYGNGTNPLEGLVSGASAASLDYLFVQFFNNPLCSASTTNFAGSFSTWAGIAASNPNGATKLLLGLPGNSAAALLTSYFLSSADTLTTLQSLRSQYPTAHVGVGVWDAYASTSGSDPNWAKSVAAGLKTIDASSTTSSSASQNHSVVLGALSSSSLVGNASVTTTSGGAETGASSTSTPSSGGLSSSSPAASSTSTTGGSRKLGLEAGGFFGTTVLLVAALLYT